MGLEARKTNAVRGAAFIERYFSGKVLDIGSGPDPVVPHARPFDVEHGDANKILDHLSPESFDCVHSSHCLEHMRDVPLALSQWWTLVNLGGHMVLVVPEEDLYEQGYWPSLFNEDHKATFRLDRAGSWSPVSYELRALVSKLPDCEIVDIRIQDDGYDRSLLRIVPGIHGRIMRRLQRLRQFLFRAFRYGAVHGLRLDPAACAARLDRIERKLGKPIDQTGAGALAQIQAVLHKRKKTD
jgi:SAM-dependent methyltransferase